MIKRFIAVFSLLSTLFFATNALAQDNAWVQIEAVPTLNAGEASVRRQAAALESVNGFRLPNGWYAIALGPYSAADAQTKMASLKASALIPGDSFIAFSRQYATQFWPVGANALNAAPIITADTGSTTEVAQVDETPAINITPPPLPDETRAQARASERSLDRDARKELQIVLQWEGFYNSGIDGAFGPGTRKAMAAYQAAKGYDETGILTTRQRVEMLAGYQAVIDSLGLQTMRDEQAGIEMAMPSAMVGFSRYEAPFVHYDAMNGSGVRVILISQTGDQNTLFGLYDILQTLEIIPIGGERTRREGDFTLEGRNSEITSYTYVRLVDGAVKGFTLIWPAGDTMGADSERRRTMALKEMKASFTSLPGMALADNAGLDEAVQSLDLLSGLEIRRPDVSRSGFFVDDAGAVLTTAAAVANCKRITINEVYDATVAGQNSDLGLAVLHPVDQLAPTSVAQFLIGKARLQSDIAVAGFPFEGRLSAPTLTFGTLADIKGLGGEDYLSRLSINVQLGDAGGPVLDNGGAVLGMLQPRSDSGPQLPGDVNFAIDAGNIAAFLGENGITATPIDAATSMHPVQMGAMAADMTVLVSCWN